MIRLQDDELKVIRLQDDELESDEIIPSLSPVSSSPKKPSLRKVKSSYLFHSFSLRNQLCIGT